MTELLLYRPTDAEFYAFHVSCAWSDLEEDARNIAYDQAQRTGKTAFACYLAIARSL